jgi:hypothetical protein
VQLCRAFHDMRGGGCEASLGYLHWEITTLGPICNLGDEVTNRGLKFGSHLDGKQA